MLKNILLATLLLATSYTANAGLIEYNGHIALAGYGASSNNNEFESVSDNQLDFCMPCTCRVCTPVKF